MFPKLGHGGDQPRRLRTLPSSEHEKEALEWSEAIDTYPLFELFFSFEGIEGDQDAAKVRHILCKSASPVETHTLRGRKSVIQLD